MLCGLHPSKIIFLGTYTECSQAQLFFSGVQMTEKMNYKQSFSSSFSQFIHIWQNGIIGIKGIKKSKKATSSGAQPDSRDYYRFKSPMSNQLN